MSDRPPIASSCDDGVELLLADGRTLKAPMTLVEHAWFAAGVMTRLAHRLAEAERTEGFEP